ncbi:MAG: VOC family protein, partial [Deltaproteobacteria bacterium]|nr:VOC family protein [Deltaproteobacteria bacterium]
GHVAIRVRDLEAAKRFYGDILCMKLGMEIPGQGLFFRFNNYHHDLAVFKARDGAEPASKNHAGVAHIALVADDFDTVLGMYRRLRENGVPVSRTIDHGATKSIYFSDPDGIELEIYCEVPDFDWRRNGMVRVPMEIENESAAKPLSPEQARSMGLRLPSDL